MRHSAALTAPPACRPWIQLSEVRRGGTSVNQAASPCWRRCVAGASSYIAAEIAMSNTTVLPFQPDSMSAAQLAAVSYLARYSGETHKLYA